MLRLAQFRNEFADKKSTLLLVYGELLLQPRFVPKGINVIAISEDHFQDRSELAFQYELN